jgi:hypothetical protein
MADPEQAPTWWQLMRQNFKWKQFILGALIPITLFYIFYRLDRPLTGALLAAGWGIGLSVVTRLFLKEINLFAVLSIPFAIIQMGGVIATRDPDFFLVWPAIVKVVWGLIFLGSLLFSRPLILVFAETMGAIPKTQDADEFRKSNEFRPIWIILTAVWGITQLASAVLVVAAMVWLPMEPFLIVRTALSLPLTAVLITFSFWFPIWYFRRSNDFRT